MRISSLQKKVKKQRVRRVTGVRKPLLETRRHPRLSVFRSGEHIYAQIIDDNKKVTVAAASDLKLKEKMTKSERAKYVGAEIAKLALKKKVTAVVMDRGWYKFHGRIKALADAARENGLKF